MSERAHEEPRSQAAHRRRLVGLLASVTLHVAGIVLLGLYSPPPERVEPPKIWTEVALLDAVPAPAAPDEPPAEEPPAEETVAEPEQPHDADEPRPAEPREPEQPPPARPSEPRPAEPAAGEPSGSQAQPGGEDAAPQSGTPKISLRNLRDTSQRSGVAVVPRLDRASLVEGGSHGSPSGARAGRSGYGPGQAPVVDGGPRSLAEAGFKPRRKDGKLVYRDPKRRFSAFITPDGKMEFRNLPGKMSALPGGAEVARAAAGQELYIKEKKQLLADTFELRLSLAIAWARAQIDRQVGALKDDLARLWNDQRMSVEERRRLLFERWDECDEGSVTASTDPEFEGAGGLDAVRRDAGGRARGAIERFIRTYLPRGSEHAYTPAELSRYNANRQSRQKFDPYGAAGADAG